MIRLVRSVSSFLGMRRHRNVKPSQLPGVAAYPAVMNMLEQHLDMQFEDLRGMLRLPTWRMRGGCNFAAASILTNLIGGFSVILYNDPDRSMPPAKEPRQRGARLRHLLRDLFPHDATIDPPKAVVVEIVYTFARNALTHALGLRQPADPEINIGKRRLTSAEIATLESSPQRPPGLVGAIVTQRYHRTFDLSVVGLYWATFRLLEGLTSDPNHMMFAEKELQSGIWVP